MNPPGDEPDWAERTSSWRPKDLTDVLNGTQTAMPRPSVGTRSDGHGVLYAGRTHTLHAETEAGKTWFALTIAATEIDDNNHVVYIDFEDDEAGITSRLRTVMPTLNVDVLAKQFHYIRPEDPMSEWDNLELAVMFKDLRPTYVVLDGVTEAMTMHGLNYLDNGDISKFDALIPRKLTRTGAAVLSLDHVVKDKDNRGRYAMGGIHKTNIVTGSTFTLEAVSPLSIGSTGISRLRVGKDRPGHLRKASLPGGGTRLAWFADMVLTSHSDDFVELELTPAREAQCNTGPFRPSVLMQRVLEAVQDLGPRSQAQLRKDVTGNGAAISAAVHCLIDENYLTPDTPHAHTGKEWTE